MIIVIAAEIGGSWFVLRGEMRASSNKNDGRFYALAECVDEAAAVELRNALNSEYDKEI